MNYSEVLLFQYTIVSLQKIEPWRICGRRTSEAVWDLNVANIMKEDDV